jgi:hypothetical protein
MPPVTETPKFSIQYIDHSPIDLENLVKTTNITNSSDIDIDYMPFNITNMQSYNPVYKTWFSLQEDNYNAVTLNNKYSMVTMDTVINLITKETKTKDVFIKYSPLLDPIRYMGGKYESTREQIHNLPSITNDGVHPKIKDPNNMAYVDCFFSYLSSKLLEHHQFINGIDFFGSFLGIQSKYKMDITDDYEYLQSSQFFIANNTKLFNISKSCETNYYNYGSHANKKRLFISSVSKHNISNINIIDTNNDNDNDNNIVLEDIELLDNDIVYTKPPTSNIHNKSETSNNSSCTDDSCISNSTDNSDGHNEDEWVTEDEDEDEDEDESICETDSNNEDDTNFAYINDFPVQCISLEKCDGTIDKLFEHHLLGKDDGISAMMQIIMILLTYQHAFKFTHNDLHTNNIMYINTEIENLYYVYNNKTYKVPTFGKIYKLIDFGRAIYQYNGHRLCSDSFGPTGDASTQYNCEPYMDDNKARLEPNFSFDLCRLGCSLYDFVIDDEDDISLHDDLQQLIHEWCLDDNKKNILYKKNGDERYPNFKLYKMIARTVHNQTPHDQLDRPIFKKYLHEQPLDITIDTIVNIDIIPQYHALYM